MDAHTDEHVTITRHRASSAPLVGMVALASEAAVGVGLSCCVSTHALSSLDTGF